MIQVLHGNFLYTPSLGTLETVPDGYLVLQDGRTVGIFSELPERFSDAERTDFKNALILPAFTDLHLHAPQYPMLGMGMDLPLLDWLERYTFRTEARFGDPDYARRIYREAGAETDRKRHDARCNVFLTAHRRDADPDGGA